MKPARHLRSFLPMITALITSCSMHAQTPSVIAIDSCYLWAQAKYPLSSQYNLLDQTKELTMKNLASENLPQIYLTGQTTYQSDVTEISVMVPGIDIPMIGKDQYKAYGEITQPLTRFKTVRQEKNLAETNHAIQKQQLAISLRPLKDRVNTLFFGILLSEAMIDHSRITKADIESGIHQLNTALKNGTALPSDLDQLKAELLQLDQKISTLQSRKRQLIRMLSLLTSRDMDKESKFLTPRSPDLPGDLNRPELELYTLQQSNINQQQELFHQKLKPRLSLFVQGGVGKPALNFLDDDFSPYYLGGLRLQWDISAYYNQKRKNEIWEVQKRTINLKSETFKLNTNLELEKYDEEIQRYRGLLRTDQDIIDLRNSIKETATHQLALGVITPVDYLTFVHQEEQARQSQALHKIQLLQASYKRLYENGN